MQSRRWVVPLTAVMLGAGAMSAGSASEAVPAGKLPQPVARILQAHGLSGKGLSVVVQPLDGTAPLVSFNPAVPRNPASTIKLLTTMAVLDALGPAYQWTTRAWLGGPLRNGTLDGDLILEGGGDPYLTAEHFWTFVRELRARGLTHIRGDLVIDADYFQVEPEDPGAFDGQAYRAYNVAPHALLVNFKAVKFNVLATPGSKKVRIVPDPPLANLRIDNRVTAVRGRCRGFQRGVSFHAPDGFTSGRVVMSGRFPANCRDYSLSRSVLDHERFAFGVFSSLWTESGGTIDGGVRNGPAPPETDQPFFVRRSSPLGDIVRSVNKYSNNVMTRQLLLTLGAERYGPPGSTATGIQALTEWLKTAGIDTAGLVMDNGAGLSRDTRVTASTLTQLLTLAAGHRFDAEFIASMPIAGLDGTLSGRFRGAPLSGRMHLKTGRLDHVVALAGFVQAKSGRRLVVVSLHNADDVHRGTGKEVQDALLSWAFEQ